MLLACLAGCTAIDKQLASLPDDVAPVRAEREEEVVQDFERTRDTALYQAALARWRAGDSVASESLLMRLLQRNDQHREARLLLADLYVATNKPNAAEEQLRLLIRRMPNDAQVHHSLGLLLESTGRTEEAVTHLQKAAELAPDNELYALSHDATRESFRSPEPTCAPSAPSPKLDSASHEALRGECRTAFPSRRRRPREVVLQEDLRQLVQEAGNRGTANELSSLTSQTSIEPTVAECHAPCEIPAAEYHEPCEIPAAEPTKPVTGSVTDQEPPGDEES